MAPYESTRASAALENSQNQPATSDAQKDVMVPATQQGFSIPGTQLDPRLEEQNMGLGYLTNKEQKARFAFEQRKMEADLAAIQARTAAEVAAIEARTACELEKSQARIAAMRTEPATMVATAATQGNEEDFLTDEISPAAFLVANKYPGLPKEEIACIFTNKFRPQNLYKLRHLQGQEEKDQEKNIFI